MMNLVFIGLVGSGYKKAAEKAASLLGRKYVDTDEVLIRNMQMPLWDYYTLFPAAAFQELSVRLAKQLSEGDSYVIGCGDSILTTPDAIRALKETGYVIYLDRSAEDTFQTCDEDGHPLLARGRQRLFEIYQERADLFTKLPDLTLPYDSSPEAFAEKAAAAFQMAENSDSGTSSDEAIISVLRQRYHALGGAPEKEEAYLQVCLSTLKGLDTAFGL